VAVQKKAGKQQAVGDGGIDCRDVDEGHYQNANDDSASVTPTKVVCESNTPYFCSRNAAVVHNGTGKLETSTGSRRQGAERLAKAALTELKEKHRDDFQDARLKGSGRFIDIVKASAEFGEKILFQETINRGGGKGCKPTKDGYLQITYKRQNMGEATENVVSVEEFASVSQFLLLSHRAVRSFSTHVVACFFSA